NIYAECVNHLSSVHFSLRSDKKSWRQLCFLLKRPGIFPSLQRTLILHLQAFRGSSKLSPKAGFCNEGKKAAAPITRQTPTHPFSRSSRPCSPKQQASFPCSKPSSVDSAPR